MSDHRGQTTPGLSTLGLGSGSDRIQSTPLTASGYLLGKSQSGKGNSWRKRAQQTSRSLGGRKLTVTVPAGERRGKDKGNGEEGKGKKVLPGGREHTGSAILKLEGRRF